jgi:ABC-type oligopeptide transport system substrate-binding subunit
MSHLPRPSVLSAVRACVGLLAVGLLGLAAWPAGDLAAGDAGRLGVGAERQQGQRPPQKKRAEEEDEGTKPAKAQPGKKRTDEEEEAKPAPKQGGKKRRVEEEEEGAKPAKRKVVRVEEEEGKAKAGRPAAVPLGDLAEAAKQAKHPGVKKLFQDLAVPHDLVTFRRFEGVKISGDTPPVQRPERVEPLPDYVGETPNRLREAVTLKVQDAEGRVRKQETHAPGEIRSIKPYEEIAAEAVEQFLGSHYENFGPAESNPKYLSRYDQLVAAEHALAAVVRFHESAKGRGVRKGEEWGPVEARLRKQLLDVSLEQLNGLTEAKDWNQAFALARGLYDTYGDPADKAKIAKPLAELLKRAVKDLSANDDKLREARQRLQQFQQQFGDRPEVAVVGNSLKEQAQALFDQAKELARDKELTRAQELLKQAEETWPSLPGLREYRVELSRSYPILRVGVRQLPRYLSPARAWTDSELRGVELLFESLVKQHPDATGVMRYEEGLAAGRPGVIQLGRRFHLPRNAQWSTTNNRPLTSSDVRYTVMKLLKEGRGTGRSAEWGKLLESVKVGGDPYVVELTLNQGYLDPLALMTFKVLPQGPDVDGVPYVDGEKFALSPVSSGPFKYLGLRSEGGRQYAAFEINPNYGSRPDKFGRPSIREVRFFQYTDAAKEFELGRLDLALDLTAEEAAKLQRAGRVKVDLPRPGAPNRRVYFLALNQRRPLLANVKLRRALAYAINREKLLDDHFRGGLKVHKALNGPYPAGSWACNPELKKDRDKDSLDLFDEARAKALAQEARDELRQPKPRLTLLYPAGDPRLAKAMEALRDQVRSATGVELELQPREDPHRLREEVEVSNAYDLAYYHYDFPDETYWLKPLLGSPGGGRENYLGAQGGPALNQLQEAMARRHFAEVRKHTWLAHEQLLQEMPLVPLWQLDPLAALHEDLEAVPFDPLLVFTDVDRWSVQRK